MLKAEKKAVARRKGSIGIGYSQLSSLCSADWLSEGSSLVSIIFLK